VKQKYLLTKITYLEQKDSFKDLGKVEIIVDKKLSLREHMSEKISKAYAMLGIK